MKIKNRCSLVPALLLLGAVGCSTSGRSSSSSGASIAPSTSSNGPSPVTSGTAPTASGSTTTPNPSTLSKNGPTITLTSPARGAFLTQAAVKVEGTVTDPVGVASLTIQGNAVIPGANGAFSEVVPLTAGLNTIVVEAWNNGFRSSKTSLSVVLGPFLPDTQPIANALALRLNASALDAIGNAAAAQLGGPMLAQQIMARNPLYRNSVQVFGVTVASAEVNATQASFGQPTLKLAPLSGALDVHAEIPSVDIVANAHDYGGIPYSITGHITADRAIVDAQIALTVQNGVVVSSVVQSSCQLQNFGWGLNGFPSVLTNLATSWVQGLIQDEVTKQVQSVVPQELNKALAGLANPFTQTVLGHQVSFAVAPNTIGQDALGMSVFADANVALAPVPGYTPITAPGSFYTGGAAPQNGGPTPGFAFSVNQDLMNRAAYEAWHSGLMELEVSNQPTSTFTVPAFFQLDGSFVQTWIPELKGKFPGNDPIAIVISPKLPPIFVAKPKPDTVEAGLGELEISCYDVAPGAARQLLVTIATHVRVTTDASISNAGILKLVANPKMFVDASLVASPLAPQLDATGVSNFVQFSLPPILQIASNTWSGFQLPAYPGLAPKNVDIDADGAQKTFTTVRGDF